MCYPKQPHLHILVARTKKVLQSSYSSQRFSNNENTLPHTYQIYFIFSLFHSHYQRQWFKLWPILNPIYCCWRKSNIALHHCHWTALGWSLIVVCRFRRRRYNSHTIRATKHEIEMIIIIFSIVILFSLLRPKLNTGSECMCWTR